MYLHIGYIPSHWVHTYTLGIHCMPPHWVYTSTLGIYLHIGYIPTHWVYTYTLGIPPHLDQSRREGMHAMSLLSAPGQDNLFCEPYVILLLGQLSGSCSTRDSQMGAGKSINHVQASSHAQSATGRAPPIHICQCATPRNVRRCSNLSACRCYCNTMSFRNTRARRSI